MKLYATVTSERATKGQGGNKFLHISITADSPDYGRKSVGWLQVDICKNGRGEEIGCIYFSETIISNPAIAQKLGEFKITTKGEKKKDEQCDVCKDVNCKNHDCIPL